MKKIFRKKVGNLSMGSQAKIFNFIFKSETQLLRIKSQSS